MDFANLQIFSTLGEGRLIFPASILLTCDV